MIRGDSYILTSREELIRFSSSKRWLLFICISSQKVTDTDIWMLSVMGLSREFWLRVSSNRRHSWRDEDGSRNGKNRTGITKDDNHWTAGKSKDLRRRRPTRSPQTSTPKIQTLLQKVSTYFILFYSFLCSNILTKIVHKTSYLPYVYSNSDPICIGWWRWARESPEDDKTTPPTRKVFTYFNLFVSSGIT